MSLAGRRNATGAFQSIPIVPTSDEHLASALKRAGRIGPNTKLKNEAARARNKTARQMDELVKAISTPLGACVKGFPAAERLHPFERALLDLTIGLELYEKRLARLTSLRQSAVQVGKAYAARAGKAANKKEAEALGVEGFENVAAVYKKGATAVDGLKDMAKQLRRLPVVDLMLPTVALVGAPNVGKSSLVQILSSGQPEICDYPFTTRSIKMGHFYVDGRRHQVTDTPGLLNRAEEDRNAMERLTVSCMAFLPTSVLFVIDLTGQCGTSPATQWQIRADLRARFPNKPWLDVFTKQDLLQDVHAQAQGAAATEQPQTLGATGSAVDSDAGAGNELLEEGEGGSQVVADLESHERVRNADREASSLMEASETAAKFSWNDRGKQGLDAPTIAAALSQAIWVSSVTESGLDDLRSAVLRMLQEQNKQEPDYPEGV
ncbi:P-loop containing nucleoside triphosphate hydrolase protein [Coccomyxa subellipsoidea C-169]|uniref:P-loop containing nucleoside triphosphate hydrolase protein n=1 Tax=Coccomyxa subellipsoidea (strain C-169) TaxID=574566 RepID=I0Z1X0_COCSC|nr:P-loop containing nucleoside triphosphate hydrolase protein [Coccomyxa subellipsoidea C-169]EIE24639.1 P-loop containing nucleoside triphosphate hydrolase protein [Coccomyxa subellipsoidea C-169]|eukprot:XP_005649183.1 P-loop containing nucleoside triphosphate hydrolase protein [Coccomyxa subellipsoidea C-169]